MSGGAYGDQPGEEKLTSGAKKQINMGVRIALRYFKLCHDRDSNRTNLCAHYSVACGSGVEKRIPRHEKDRFIFIPINGHNHCIFAYYAFIKCTST